ncbi:Maf family protein [Dethiobacter alkaliphilus]|uniref:dTTP/UTP pyrophosphatase n=1 Tax=Dethiobacter alkaliphilus AHT 1 TaxID=555088 RepID=C0GEW6_DETAL|nr:Maf family protein [Dethiobacter alkaliphilus]EEG78148.1 maf protein [Dethiobacter alkaliphilus AHT 1]
MTKLILASASPRRAQLLQQIGLKFAVKVSGVDENENEKDPARLAKRLALNKANAVAMQLTQGIIIAADTVVCIDGKLLGKPKDSMEAKEMLRSLSGRTHHVLTGVAVIDSENHRTLDHVETTAVKMRHLREEEIDGYVQSGEPFDKAGGYGIQGKAAIFVEKLDGCYFNVVGLPLSALCLMLEEMGVQIWGRS